MIIGKFDLAISNYTNAIALIANNPLAFYNRGLAYINLKDFIRASNDMAKVISIDSNHIKAYYKYTLIKYKLKEYSSAIEIATKALEFSMLIYVDAYL